MKGAPCSGGGERGSTVILSFSPRPNGNCAGIAREVCALLGSSAQSYGLPALSVTPCGRCDYECFEERERCPHFGDDVFALYEAILRARQAVFILPNYCDYPCADFFAFNERSQCCFQHHGELLERYLAVRKKFIVVSNTGRDNFVAALRYHVPQGQEPEILFLSAREFQKVSIRGDLMDVPQARMRVAEFLKE